MVFTVLEQSWNLFSENVHLPKTVEIAKRNLGAYPGGLAGRDIAAYLPRMHKPLPSRRVPLNVTTDFIKTPKSQSMSEAKSFCKAECFQRIFKTQFRNRGISGPLGNVPWGGGSTCLMTRSRRYLCYQHPCCLDGEVTGLSQDASFPPFHSLLKPGPTAGGGNANLFFGPKHLFSFQILISQISVIINLVNNMI